MIDGRRVGEAKYRELEAKANPNDKPHMVVIKNKNGKVVHRYYKVVSYDR